ncbi:hypothetical protein H257_03376 [Aphanomyces astaci]|uniref:Uncharacterized protein n=1 Tax=Aphanomyces astaci TaxID=112090 RepID=W4GYL3_APHAT|nr:hypothetical protein H257_03376 [Aphanomyces astaci]ETV84018.1 hypothetical protein H257_03376 [Aphanomyces astaci]|eukprot:XP_009825710.1 hypothetical protein H257_03376 [Aphanomyces astaci]
MPSDEPSAIFDRVCDHVQILWPGTGAITAIRLKISDRLLVSSPIPMHAGEVDFIADERAVERMGKTWHQYLVHWARPHLLACTRSWVISRFMKYCPEAFGVYTRWRQHPGNLTYSEYRVRDAQFLEFGENPTKTCLFQAFKIISDKSSLHLRATAADLVLVMTTNTIPLSHGIPQSKLRAFVQFLFARGLRICLKMFASELLTNQSGDPKLDLYRIVLAEGNGMFLVTTVSGHTTHVWVLTCVGSVSELADAEGTIGVGELPSVDFVRADRRISDMYNLQIDAHGPHEMATGLAWLSCDVARRMHIHRA